MSAFFAMLMLFFASMTGQFPEPPTYNTFLPLVMNNNGYVVTSQTQHDNAYIWYWEISGNVENITDVAYFTDECFITEAGSWSYVDGTQKLNMYNWVHKWTYDMVWWKPNTSNNPLRLYALTFEPRDKGEITLWINGLTYQTEGPTCKGVQ